MKVQKFLKKGPQAPLNIIRLYKPFFVLRYFSEATNSGNETKIFCKSRKKNHPDIAVTVRGWQASKHLIRLKSIHFTLRYSLNFVQSWWSLQPWSGFYPTALMQSLPCYFSYLHILMFSLMSGVKQVLKGEINKQKITNSSPEFSWNSLG